MENPSKNESILIASGDSSLRERCHDALTEAGFSVEVAGDDASTMELIGRLDPDLVLLDNRIPAGGGEGVARAIRLMPSGVDKPIVFLIQAEDQDLVAAAAEAGVDEFVVDTFHADLLVHRVRRVLRGLPVEPLPEPAPRRTQLALVSNEECLDRKQLLAGVQRAIPVALEASDHVAIVLVSLEFKGLAVDYDINGSDDRVLDQLRVAIRAYEACEPGISAHGEIAIARLEREKYAVMVSSVTQIQPLRGLGEKICEQMNRPLILGGHETNWTVRVGIASSPTNGNEASEVLRCAETAAYCARQQAGDGILFYAESMSRWAFERLTLEHSLRQAVENNELELYYQPRVDIRANRIVGMEALIRWNHPQLGRVSPAQFIPLAEETGLIVPIGEWVLATACDQNKEWQEKGIPPIRVSVNLSPRQFSQPDLFDTVIRCLQVTGLSPEWLELELTESMLMKNAKQTIDTLQEFRRAGISLSIDDFGTGYSSLSYLKRFSIDALKIDQSFIRDVTSNPDDAAIATAIILMGRSLKLQVIAEGVETNSQLQFLKVLHCDEAQGYLFSPPVPAAQADALLLDPPDAVSAA